MPGLPPGYDGVAVAKGLLRTVRAGALGSLSREGGFPFASLVNVATDIDGSPVLLMSGLSAHTKNLLADPRASILLAEGGKGDPLAHPRLTVVGHARQVMDENLRARLRRRFLGRHPKSSLYVDFPDFSFWRLELSAGHLNGGFARAADFDGRTLLTPLAGAGELLDAEESAVEHMNSDHSDAARLYATRLAGEKEGPWRVSGIDPEGVDLTLGDRTARVAFNHRVETAADLRKTLAEMAARARQAQQSGSP
jgi:putative heme iron utilization protein